MHKKQIYINCNFAQRTSGGGGFFGCNFVRRAEIEQNSITQLSSIGQSDIHSKNLIFFNERKFIRTRLS